MTEIGHGKPMHPGDTYIEAINRRDASLQRYQSLVYAPNFGQVAGYSPGTINGIGSGSAYSQTCTTGLPVFEKFTPSDDWSGQHRLQLGQYQPPDPRNHGGQLQVVLVTGLNCQRESVRFAVGASYRG